MFEAKVYPWIYLVVVSLLSVIVINTYSSYTEQRIENCNVKSQSGSSIILTLALIIFIGFRPTSYLFVDMGNYQLMWDVLRGGPYKYDSETSNFIFDNLFHYLASLDLDISIFYLIIAAIYFGCIAYSVSKIFPNDTLYALLMYLAAFSTFSYGTNGIKAGAAASLFLLVFANYKSRIWSIVFCVLSLGFHHSMFFPIVAYWIAYYVKNEKYFFSFWILCFIIAACHITFFQHFLGSITEGSKGYLDSDAALIGMKSGFRIDFIIYGFLPVIIGYWATIKKRVNDRLYHLLLCTYLLTNAIWMLCMYAAFNNRIAYLSWFILPIVSIYPFLKLHLCSNQYKLGNYLALTYLAFTIFAYNFL